MSEKSSGDERFECLSIVFHHCIGNDERLTKDLAKILKDNDIVDKDEKTKYLDLVRKKETATVIDLMLKRVASSGSGINKFPDYLKDMKDLPEHVAELLSVISGENPDKLTLQLVKGWHILVEQEEQLKGRIKELIPEHHLDLALNWPVNFINKCTADMKEQLESILEKRRGLENKVENSSDVSETCMGEERFECLSVVFHHCIGNDERLTKDLANVLKDNDVIEKDEKKKYIELVRKKDTATAIDLMLERVASSESGINKFPDYLDEMEDLSKHVVKLVWVIVGDHPPNLTIRLVKSWHTLTEQEELLKAKIKELSPKFLSDLACDWPVSFINICTENVQGQLQSILEEIGVLEVHEENRSNTSEACSRNERLECLSIVFHHCIGNDERLTKDLANVLKDNDVIERDEKKKFIELVRKKDTATAIDLMLERVASSESGINKFPDYLGEIEDLPEHVVKLVSVIAGDAPKLTIRLVKNWHILTEGKELLEARVKELNPEFISDLAWNWPVSFINICTDNMQEQLQSILNEIGVLEDNKENTGDMSKACTEHDRFECLSIVFRHCIGNEKKLTKDLANILKDNDVIERDEKKRYIDLVGKNDTATAIDLMLERVANSESGINKFPDYLDEMENLPEHVVKLVSVITGDNPPNLTIRLVKSWHTLTKREELLKEKVKEMSPELLPKMALNWPVSFIKICTENMQEQLQSILKEIGVLEDNEKTDNRPRRDTDISGTSPSDSSTPIEEQMDLFTPNDNNHNLDETEQPSIDSTYEVITNEELRYAAGTKDNQIGDKIQALEWPSSEEPTDSNLRHCIIDAHQDSRENIQLLHEHEVELTGQDKLEIANEGLNLHVGLPPGIGPDHMEQVTAEENDEQIENPVEPMDWRTSDERTCYDSERYKTDALQGSDDGTRNIQLPKEDNMDEIGQIRMDVIADPLKPHASPGPKTDSIFEPYTEDESGNKRAQQNNFAGEIGRNRQDDVAKPHNLSEPGSDGTEQLTARGKIPEDMESHSDKVASKEEQGLKVDKLKPTDVQVSTPTPPPRRHTSQATVKLEIKRRIKEQPLLSSDQDEKKLPDLLVETADPNEFIEKNFEKLKACEELLRPLFNLAWPEKEFIHNGQWLLDMDDLFSSENQIFFYNFVFVCQFLTQEKEKLSSATFTSTHPIDPQKWILMCRNRTEQQHNALTVLCEVTWREKLPEPISERKRFLINKSKPDIDRFDLFIQVANTLFEIPEQKLKKKSEESSGTKLRLEEQKLTESYSSVPQPEVCYKLRMSTRLTRRKKDLEHEVTEHASKQNIDTITDDENSEEGTTGNFTKQKPVQRRKNSKAKVAGDKDNKSKSSATSDVTHRDPERKIPLQTKKTDSMFVRLQERRTQATAIIRVAVKGIRPDEQMCFEVDGKDALLMEHLGNHVYSYTVNVQGQLTYSYLVFHKKGRYREETAAGKRTVRLLQTSHPTYIYDEAWFTHETPVVGQLMHHHLPQKHDEVFRSEILKYEVSGWLHQMQLGWWYYVKSKNERSTVPIEVVQKILIRWLQDLHADERIMATLTLVFAWNKHNICFQDNLLRNIIGNLALAEFDRKSQEAQYSQIRKLFCSDNNQSLESLEKAMLKMFHNICCDIPEWLLTVPLFYLVKENGHISHDVNAYLKEAFLQSKIGYEVVKSLTPVWEKMTKDKVSNKYQENLRSMESRIEQIAHVHPWIAYLYQYLLTEKSIMKLFLERSTILQTFQLDILLGQLVHYLELEIKKLAKGKSAAMLENIDEHFYTMFSNAKEQKLTSKMTEQEKIESVSTVCKMLLTLSKSLEKEDIADKNYISFCIGVASLAAKWAYDIAKQGETIALDDVEQLVQRILVSTVHKIEACNFSQQQDLQFCNAVLATRWYPALEERWKDSIQSWITSLIQKAWLQQPEEYLKFFRGKIPVANLSEELMLCFETNALSFAQEILRVYQDSPPPVLCGLLGFSKSVPQKIMSFFDNLFLTEFAKYDSEKEQQTKQILKFAMEWPISSLFMQTFNNENALQYLPKARPKFRKIEKICQTFIASLDARTVSVDLLELIGRNHCAKICEFIQSSTARIEGSRTDNLRHQIENHLLRIEQFQIEHRQMAAFIKLCKSLKCDEIIIDYSKLKTIYDGIKPSSEVRLLFLSEDVENAYSSFHELTDQDMKEMALMEQLEKSKLFGNMWHEVARNYRTAKDAKQNLFIDWKEALTDIWLVVKNELHNLAISLCNGKIGVKAIADRFQFSEGNSNKIRKELEIIFQFVDEINGNDLHSTLVDTKIVERIYNVFEIKKNWHGLEWTLKFKEKFQLTGDFATLEKFPDLEKDDMTIDKIDENILRLYPEELKQLTPTELEHLQTFLVKGDLISWLKKAKDVNELKTLCDLITTSASETPHETDRITYLLNATQGFAPLLFHLEEVNSLRKLMDRCNKVKSNIERDPKIVIRWKDSAHNLQWFIARASLFGSDQKRCLRKAQEINQCGVYTVGKTLQQKSRTPGLCTLEDSIALTVRLNGEETETETYTLHELQDLQSKLMLIAGEEEQGQQDIQQFSDLFGTVKSLGDEFTNLVNAGCMLFCDWTVVIESSEFKTMDRRNEPNLFVMIRFVERSKSLSSNVTLYLLQDLARALRETFKEWVDYIASKRLHHYYLNEYSIQQITYLCHELAITQNLASLPDQVLALLSKDILVAGAIQDALEEAIKIEDKEENEVEDGDYPTEEVTLTDLEKKKRAIRILVNRERLEENLAKAAVQALGSEDIEECNNWALLNQFETELIATKSKLYDDENASVLQSNQEEELISVVQNRSVRSLTEMIDQILAATQNDEKTPIVGAVRSICQRYLKRTSVLTLQDYLSLEHLGRFLAILHEKNEVQKIVKRPMISALQPRNPNLIVCSEADTLSILLSLYMEHPDQPLPTTSEVLLCSESTSCDEVARFMRRAMCKCNTNGKPMFCMAFANKLNFKASQEVENIFNDLIKRNKHINDDYQLVILTCSAAHYVSGCFEKYQIPKWQPRSDVDKISSYLKRHLTPSHSINDGNSLVKIVTSSRSSVGKSLFVSKLRDRLTVKWYEDFESMPVILDMLKRTDNGNNILQRRLPDLLKPGEPNLILCEDKIAPLLMSLYMHDPAQPTPTATEVLLCSHETTEDEVERFMRRAILKQHHEARPIYAMAYTNHLPLSLAEKVEELYNTLSISIHAKKSFQLVMLSTTVGAFDWCKMYQAASDNTVAGPAKICGYIENKQAPEEFKLTFEEATLSHQNKKALVLRRLIRRENLGEKEAKAAVRANGYNDITKCIRWVLENKSNKELIQTLQDEYVEENAKEKKNKTSDAEQKSNMIWRKTTIRLLEKNVDTNHVLRRLYREEHFRNEHQHFIHFDLTPAVENGIERFMFNLLVLGSIQDDLGRVWNRQSQHLYVIEMTKSALNKVQVLKNSILNLLPCVRCLSPAESLEKYREVKDRTSAILREFITTLDDKAHLEDLGLLQHLNGNAAYKLQDYSYQEQVMQAEPRPPSHQVLQLSNIPDSVISYITEILPNNYRSKIEAIYSEEDLPNVQLMDFTEFISTTFQRPYQYLKHSDMQDVNLDDFQYSRPAGNPSDCIEVLWKRYGSSNPSWAQLRHFTSFLNLQLQNCEESMFCQKIEQNKSGSRFWQHTELEGLKQFAVNFMIRMAQDFATPSLDTSDQSSKDANEDTNIFETHQIRRKWEEKCHPYVFFNDDRASMSFINVSLNGRGDLLDENEHVLEEKVASKNLMQGLAAQGMNFGFNFEKLNRKEKLEKLCTIMGLPPCVDDPDPTYELTTENALKILAIYMRLRCNIPVIVMGETGCGKTRMVEFMSKLRARGKGDIRNMVTLKIHGGIKADHIYKSVEKAINIALANRKQGSSTILFYDEANTTTAIHAIKEVICDGTIDGESFHDSQLQIVAACNPYKCLSRKAIEKMENLGLGYRVVTSKTSNCLGSIPMRRLVYKVVALPPSMQPFVWDFGQLSIAAEQKYINQMTVHLQEDLRLSSDEKDLIDFLFFQAQSYMKDMVDECRYVSLRDVERCMKFFKFFHGLVMLLSPKIEKKLKKLYKPQLVTAKDDILRCLIQTLGVCYHVSLDNRRDFRQHISASLGKQNINLSESEINDEIISCQEVFLDNITIASNIAPNEALRENVYLITICLQLQIPLFLVGKPGSSKSLAKSIVADNMDGSSLKTPLYKQMKQVDVFSYQCSALTDADGIEKIFKKASDSQKGKNLKEFTAVVVLDEIGLAEDSPNMPLKILHPLLECGSTESGTIADTAPNKKVAFVGISNWALDPAKMNRGIFVTRSTPSEDDLLGTAKAIMKKSVRIMEQEEEMLESFTRTYLKIYDAQRQQGSKEYFGLRDYYSLIKMVNSNGEDKEKCEYQHIAHAVERNFSGGYRSYFEEFTEPLKKIGDGYRLTTTQEMIKENLRETDTRFLLLLTTQHSSVYLLERIIENFHKRVQVIYGSSFPGDHTYTEICRNINRIKVCMETGRIVVLLNMTEVHESLYDALNQHYTTYGGQRYVDIGLGGHRLKCRVADNFRLIVMEQKNVVYQDYPIPLVNRLEKHHLVSSCLLSAPQTVLFEKLTTWSKQFAKVAKFSEHDAFIGFNEDTISSVVILQDQIQSMELCKEAMLQAATVDAVFRFMGNYQCAAPENLLTVYTEAQVHDSLMNLLKYQMQHSSEKQLSVTEVTSFSNILTETDRKRLARFLNLPENCVTLLSLQQFDTQQDYITKLEKFFGSAEEDTDRNIKILLIQCPQAHQQELLLSCAKYCLMNMLKKLRAKLGKKIIVSFLYSTQRQHSHHGDTKLILQHTSGSQIVFVDDLRPPSASNATVSKFYGKSIADVLQMGSEEINQGQSALEYGINFLGMLKDTICQAIAKVKRDNKTEPRNIRCIELLTAMCKQSGWIEKIFLTQLAKLMSNIYQSRESSMHQKSKESWIIQEACLAKRLQEGGTFGKTLCLCLKRQLADLLAFCISTIDENNNLTFLFVENQTTEISWKVTLWLQFFEVFTLEWGDMKDLKEFQVAFSAHLPADYTPQFPFSFALNVEMNSHWHAVRDEGRRMEMFCHHGTQSKYTPVISKAMASSGTEMVQMYAADLIRCHHNFGNLEIEDYEMLTNILLTVSQKLSTQLVEENAVEEVDSLRLVYYCYKDHFKYLEILSEIFKVQPGISSKTRKWLEASNETDQFNIHALAVIDLLDWVAAYKIHDNVSCIKWMELTDQCKKILNHGAIEQTRYKDEIFRKWKPSSLLDLLLLRLLPSDNSALFTKYVNVVVTHAKRLLKPLQKYGFCDKSFVRIVLNVLRKSHEDVKMKILVSWQDLICKMCKKAFTGPVKLPCGHFICIDCTERMFAATDTRRQCPICPTSIPQDFKREVATLTDKEEKESSVFRANCTSFFLEYLAQFCFYGAESGVDDHIELFLHELVMGIPVKGKRMELETWAIDLNIITQANIFQLLLDHDAAFVENKINEQLSSNSLTPEQMENLIAVILCGHESRIQQRDSWETFEKNWEHIRSTEILTLSSLRLLAQVRYYLQKCIEETKKKFLSPEVMAAIGPCAQDDTGTLRAFMVKMGCQKFGSGWFSYIYNHPQLKELVPVPLQNTARERSIDYWLLTGDSYNEVRQKLSKTSYNDWMDVMPNLFPPGESMKKMMLKILAVANHEKSHYFHRLCDYMSEVNSKSENIFSVIKLFHKVQIPHLSNGQKSLLMQLVVLVNCIVVCKPYMMDNFFLLITEPRKTATLFWPAMPVSMFFSIRDVLLSETVTAAYICPNGHTYLIGECTQPYQEAQCPDCGETIGGRFHKAAEGNQRVEYTEEAEKSYQLKSDTVGKDDPSDRMSKQSVAVVHLIMHSCMLAGLKCDADIICGMLLAQNTDEAEEYLYQKIQDNIRDFSDALGRNYDDALVGMYACMRSIIDKGFNQVERNSHDWTTMDKRVKWEDEFRRHYLLPVFQELDRVLINAQCTINNAEDLPSMMLYRIVHEIHTDEHPRELSWNHPVIWKTIKHSNTAHLLQTIRDSESTGGVLKIMLEMPNLHLLQHLNAVLSLQRALITKYQNHLDLKIAESITFCQETDGFKKRQLVEHYITLWNKIYEVFDKRSHKQLKDYLHPIDENTPITMALPSTRGRGRCAKLFAEHLIDMHNNFLDKCYSVVKMGQKASEVDVSQLNEADCICLDKQLDLLDMIRMHTSYRITRDSHGSHHHISYDIDALEKKVREKYVIYKPRIIKKSLPCIKYPQDIGIGSDWNKVKAHISQGPLSSKLAQEVDGIVSNPRITQADVCEGVRTMTYAICFLAKIKVDPKMPLQRYLEQTLLLSPNHMVMIPKNAFVCHALALYQRLMWHKAVNFVRQGLNPYQESLYNVEQVKIVEVQVLRQLNEAFAHMDIDVFQQRLNEMLIQVPDFKPEWRLKDIFPDLQFIDNDLSKAWFERLPKELCFKHVSHLFELSVTGVEVPQKDASS